MAATPARRARLRARAARSRICAGIRRKRQQRERLCRLPARAHRRPGGRRAMTVRSDCHNNERFTPYAAPRLSTNALQGSQSMKLSCSTLTLALLSALAAPAAHAEIAIDSIADSEV